jgi:hypothetical protein
MIVPVLNAQLEGEIDGSHPRRDWPAVVQGDASATRVEGGALNFGGRDVTTKRFDEEG